MKKHKHTCYFFIYFSLCSLFLSFAFCFFIVFSTYNFQSPLTTADALLSVVTDLLKQLGLITVQQAQQEINLILGVDEEIEKLSNCFKIVQAMLNDAEERQLTEAAVKLWLDQLRDVYYMMDDVLDKWKTARIKSEIQKEEERAVTDNNHAALKKKKISSPLYQAVFVK